MAPEEDIPEFPARAHDAHKGEVGRIVVIGGRLDDWGMVGAPALAANAALRSGCGLVQVLTTREAQSAVSILAPCAITRVMDERDTAKLADVANDFHADVVAIGPGLSPRVSGRDIMALIETFEGAVVIDADGLNAVAKVGRWQAARRDQVVLTPHPGEMKRLLEGLSIATKPERRRESAESLAKAARAVVVHKGAGTVVTDGQRTYVNRSGHSGMATAGSGDVLTGVVAGLIGQNMTPYDAAVLGVYLHGRAGELAGERMGEIAVTARDLTDHLAEAIKVHRGN